MYKLSLSHRLPQAIDLDAPDGTSTADAGEPRPRLQHADATFDLVEAIDVLEHVMDVEAWLAECARVLVPNGLLVVQVPYDGWTDWLEHLNIYRYMTDVLGIGTDPQESKLIGWHRQYKGSDVLDLVKRTGFDTVRIERHSLGIAELPALAHLLISDAVRREPDTGNRVKRRRVPVERRDAAIPAGPLSRRIRITARKLS